MIPQELIDRVEIIEREAARTGNESLLAVAKEERKSLFKLWWESLSPKSKEWYEMDEDFIKSIKAEGIIEK